MQLILDMGSGNTCRNDKSEIAKMIAAVFEADTGKHDIVFKWQLFDHAGINLPLDRKVFDYAYDMASECRYKTTASVFDKDSLKFLLKYDVPFVKIACRPELYGLANYAEVPVYVSVSSPAQMQTDCLNMCCVPKYPATFEEYEQVFKDEHLQAAISDHVPGWTMYNRWAPAVLEKHFVHERRSDNPDAGAFAVTPAELRSIL